MTTTYTGRVGNIVTRALRDFSDSANQTYLIDADCLAWINEAKDVLANSDAFIKTDTFDADAGVWEYALRTELSDYVQLHDLFWGTEKLPMVAASSHQAFRNWQRQGTGYSTPAGYFLLSDTLVVTPAPTSSVTDGFEAVYAYRPADMTGGTGYDTPPTTAAKDQYYVEYILFKAFQRREADTYPRGQSMADKHQRNMLQLKAEILGTLTPDAGFMPYR